MFKEQSEAFRNTKEKSRNVEIVTQSSLDNAKLREDVNRIMCPDRTETK